MFFFSKFVDFFGDVQTLFLDSTTCGEYELDCTYGECLEVETKSGVYETKCLSLKLTQDRSKIKSKKIYLYKSCYY